MCLFFSIQPISLSTPSCIDVFGVQFRYLYSLELSDTKYFWSPGRQLENLYLTGLLSFFLKIFYKL